MAENFRLNLFIIIFLVFTLNIQTLCSQDYTDYSGTGGQFMFLPVVVAEINGRKINREEAVQMLKQKIPADKAVELPASKVRTLIRESINEMIDQSIIEQKLKEKKIQPSPEMVTAEFRRLFNLLTPEKQAFLKSELAAKNLTLEQYEAKASKDVQEQFRIAFNKWIEMNFADKLSVKDEEIETYYRKNQGIFSVPASVTISQILIKKKDPKEESKNRDRAESVLARLRQGEDFGKLAQQFSECAVSKDRQGLLGTFNANGELPAGVENAAFALKTGEFSEIIDEQIGFFIIKVNDRTEPGYIPYETVKEILRIQLRDNKVRALVQESLLKERAKMQITINL
ncbi:MAG: peptidylprolyl isomerase [Victivallaceae bacterium]